MYENCTQGATRCQSPPHSKRIERAAKQQTERNRFELIQIFFLGSIPQKLEETNNCWEWIAKKLGRPVEYAYSVERMVRTFGCSFLERPRNIDLYNARRPQLLPLADHNTLLSALENQQVGLVVYFRALDRFPGGNADMRVMKFKFFLPACWPDDPGVDKKQGIVTFSSYSNGDGTNILTLRPESKWRFPCETIQKEIMAPLIKMLKEESGGTDVETHVVCEDEDEESELAEWNSIEVLIHLPPLALPEGIRSDIPGEVGLDTFPSPSSPSAFTLPTNGLKETDTPIWFPPPARGPDFEWPLVFRYHQRVLMPNFSSEYRENEDLKVTPRPTNETNAELLKNIKNLLGITDVTETLENPTFFTCYEDGNLVGKPILDNVYACPLFLYD
jgi:hypothetical protein